MIASRHHLLVAGPHPRHLCLRRSRGSALLATTHPMKAILVREFGGPEVLRRRRCPIRRPTVGDSSHSRCRCQPGGRGHPQRHPLRANRRCRPARSTAPAGIESVGAQVTGFRPRSRLHRGRVGHCAERCLRAGAARPPAARADLVRPGRGARRPSTARRIARCFIARTRARRAVLVHGATGGVGIAAVQLARAHGCASSAPAFAVAVWTLCARRAPTSWNHRTAHTSTRSGRRPAARRGRHRRDSPVVNRQGPVDSCRARPRVASSATAARRSTRGRPRRDARPA